MLPHLFSLGRAPTPVVPLPVPIMVAAVPIPVAGRAGTLLTVSLTSPRLAAFLNVPIHVVSTVFALVPPIPHAVTIPG
eukprot:COSAG02_NODE_1762_length_11027_cov_27.491947_5_plen_78_part_00